MLSFELTHVVDRSFGHMCNSYSRLDYLIYILMTEDLDGTAISAFRRAIAVAKQSWSVIGWVSKSLVLAWKY
jgi:hypothetical protein